MSKIFLLSSNITVEPYAVYPLGMAVVASALKARGHDVCQFDFLAAGRSESRLWKSLNEFSPDFVGISLRNIDNVDSLTPQSDWYLPQTKRLVEQIRAETTVPVIIGGPAFSIMPEDILDFIGADYGIVGEGEHRLCDLIEALAQGEPVSRIAKGNGNPLNGTAMASPCWDANLIRFYVERSGLVNLQTKRGCPHKCNYCSYPQLEGNRLRVKKPQEAVDEIQQAKEAFGVQTICFTDSVFNDIAGHYLEVAEELLRRNLNIHWHGFFRPQGIGSKDLNLLKRSGLSAVEVGTDAPSNTTLIGLTKSFSFAEVIEFNKACIREEIPAAHFIIFGGPDETMETVREGLDTIQKLENCVVFAFSGIRILPGTGLHERAVRDGVVDPDASLLKPVYYFSPEINPDVMNSTIKTAFHGRRNRVFPPSESFIRIAAMNRFGYRGLLWDKLISFTQAAERSRPKK